MALGIGTYTKARWHQAGKRRLKEWHERQFGCLMVVAFEFQEKNSFECLLAKPAT
jgi:hypothetical protein